MVLTIITLLITIVFFIWGRIRSDIVAMMALMVLTASGVLTTQEALSGFSSPIVLMMVGLFIVGGAILQTGLAQSVGNGIARLSGGNETRAFVLVMLATAVIGEQYRNCSHYDAHHYEHGCDVEYPCLSFAHACGFCREFGRNAHTYWYASQPCYQ